MFPRTHPKLLLARFWRGRGYSRGFEFFAVVNRQREVVRSSYSFLRVSKLSKRCYRFFRFPHPLCEEPLLRLELSAYPRPTVVFGLPAKCTKKWRSETRTHLENFKQCPRMITLTDRTGFVPETLRIVNSSDILLIELVMFC